MASRPQLQHEPFGRQCAYTGSSMSRSHGWRTSRSQHSKEIALIIVGASTFGFSCSTNPVTTWSTEARSSDTTWVATARSLQWSGPGNAYEGTSVEVKHGGLPSTEVLFFSHESPRIRLTMAWVLAVLGVAGLGYSIWSAIEGWAALRWPVVEGEITSSKVKQIPGVRRFGYGGPSYEPSVAYSYRVLGTTYSGTRLRFGGEP